MGAFRSAIACGLVLAGGAVQGADVASVPATFVLRIERQPLDSALRQLATQCGLQVIFFSRVTEGLSAPAVEGERTLEKAMEDLLAGSGLTFRVINPQTVEIRPAQSRAPDYSREPSRIANNVEHNWRVALSVDNVFDKIYYESIGSPALRGWYGAPRSWTLRVDGRY